MTRANKTTKGRSLGAAAGIAGVAALAGLAWFNRRKARQAEQAHPPLGRIAAVDGVRLHFVERGRGQPLLLIHGNGTSIADWETSGLLDALARDHHVIAIDRPGYGYSNRPRATVWTPAAQGKLLASACRAFGISRPLVVGHSFGASVALAMALDDPAALAGLVLLSGYYYPTARLDVLVAAPPAIPLIGDVMRHTVTPIAGAASFRAVATGTFAPAPPDERFIKANRDLAVRPSQIRAEAADAALMLPAAYAMAKRYGKLSLPVVIAAGSGDLLISTENESERLHGEIPGSLFRKIEGAGHMVHYSHQAEVLDVIGELERAAH